MTAPEAAILKLEPQTKKDLEEGSCPSPGGAAATGTCRLAAPGDRHHFVRLWGAFLEAERKAGSTVWADDHNLRLYREIFDSYARGHRDGLVVFWYTGPEDPHPSGVLMVGDDGLGRPWHTDTRMEGRRLATLWGVYVKEWHRGHRVGLQMEQFGRPLLVGMGFTDVATSVRSTNPLGRANWRHWDEACGVQPVETVILASLVPKET